MGYQLYSVDGRWVPLVGAAHGPTLGLAEQPYWGTAGGTGIVLAAGCAGCLWEGSLLCL